MNQSGFVFFDTIFKCERVTINSQDDHKTQDEQQMNTKLKDFYDTELKDYDPINVSFKNSREATEDGEYYIEYKDKYDEVIEENFNFSSQILSLCKTQKEANMLLQNDLSSAQHEGPSGGLNVKMLGKFLKKYENSCLISLSGKTLKNYYNIILSIIIHFSSNTSLRNCYRVKECRICVS